VVSVTKREIRIDIEGFRTGIVRGRELSDDPGLADVKPGDEIEATVVELENENGELELSLRSAGQRRAWDRIQNFKEKKEAITIYIIEANKGGLLGSFEGARGFLPVSQLSPENYPRVSGGDKSKILEKLRSFIGQKIKVKVLDADENEQKLIFSEKNLWEEEQKTVIEKYKVGDAVEGEVSALADFGAFVKFNDLEGLVHISEIAWQRIDHPSDLLKVGQKIKAQIVGIEGSKIFLSIKKLADDPWKEIAKKYEIGQIVKGKILKINPFGFFVELDDDIHGLAHVSELGLEFGKKPEDIAKPGDDKDFKIISIEPEYHRLGLSLKAMKEKKEEKKPEEKLKENTEKKEEKVTPAETPKVPSEKSKPTESTKE
ncbi:MAG: S1 RNA-binding domain-containing protein, partial [Patescibacteria group bacterium]|nr:S1 RNA-binding domain-containing protein [Patescibacteria group bacterium]